MKKFCYLVFFLFVVLAQTAYAQKIKKVSGTGMVRMGSNMTLEQARIQAEEDAKVNAIERTFGTYVEEQTDIYSTNDETTYNIIGSTKVKGEWIETTDIRFDNDFRKETGAYGDEQVRYVICYIKGKARDVVPKANIRFEVLNTPNPASRTNAFYDGEQLYLYFKSPVDGYLAVYLDDGNSAYCLLPDEYSPPAFSSGVFVKGDKDYLFFAPKHNDLPQSQVEEYIMFANSKIEYNTLYIIFSEEKFVKPVLKRKEKRENKILPRSLSSENFQKWLAEQRAACNSFQDRRVKISIRAKRN